MPEPKPIKLKSCKVCGTEFKPFKTTQKVCGWKCAAVEGKEVAKKKEAKDWQKRKKTIKESLETRTQKINKTRIVFQKWVRLRDKDLPCISCGINYGKFDAGHYLKAELYTGLIFDENNIAKQCYQCNKPLGGAQAEFRIGLVNRIGESGVKALEARKDALRTYQWSDYELEQIKNKYQSKISNYEHAK